MITSLNHSLYINMYACMCVHTRTHSNGLLSTLVLLCLIHPWTLDKIKERKKACLDYTFICCHCRINKSQNSQFPTSLKCEDLIEGSRKSSHRVNMNLRFKSTADYHLQPAAWLTNLSLKLILRWGFYIVQLNFWDWYLVFDAVEHTVLSSVSGLKR